MEEWSRFVEKLKNEEYVDGLCNLISKDIKIPEIKTKKNRAL